MTISRIAGWAAFAALGAALAPPIDPWVDAPPRAVPLGLASGVMLFALLARRRITLAAVASLPLAGVAARSLVLTVRAAYEEAVWRGLVLGLLAAPLGRVCALVTSTLLFAGSHLRLQGRRAAIHVATGAVFGLAYGVDEPEGCVVHSIPGADHCHQRYDAGPARDEKHRPAVLRFPDKPAADRSTYLDRVTGHGISHKKARHLAVRHSLHRDLDSLALRRSRQRVTAGGLIAVRGGQPDVKVLPGQMTRPSGYLEYER